MSWQEELRKLDEELAAGQISADDYRVRRDQVLSSAVSPEVRPAQPAEPDPTRQVTPLPPPTGPNPPGPQPPAALPGEHTQVVSGQGDDADRTQIVPGPSADSTQQVSGWHTARPQGDDADRTQVVPGVPPQRLVGGVAPRPAPGQGPSPQYPGYQQPWQQQEEDFASPWAGAEFPPLVAPANPDWIKQGPEVFDSGGRSKTGRIALIMVLVLVIAGLGVGGYFLINRDKDAGSNLPPQTQSSQPSPTTRTSPPRPKDDLEVADLPGQQEPTDHIKTFGDAETSGGFLTPEETQVFKTAEAGKARFASTVLPNGIHAFVFTTETPSAAKAVAARDALAKLQIKYGLTEDANPPTSVPTEEIAKTDKNPATIRAHYSHKGTVVRIQVWGDDLALAQTSYDEVIALQLKALSADA